MKPTSNPPTLDECRDEIRAEMRLAAHQLAELYTTGMLPDLPKGGDRKRKPKPRPRVQLPGLDFGK